MHPFSEKSPLLRVWWVPGGSQQSKGYAAARRGGLTEGEVGAVLPGLESSPEGEEVGRLPVVVYLLFPSPVRSHGFSTGIHLFFRGEDNAMQSQENEPKTLE